ncbi:MULTISPECIES: glutaredoxin-like protein NrdH [Enterococcus]|uniref:Glutaredoxin-like protein NrdH n=1 Tax=Enterococcus sulfureus ATCC 49903 TaxID=1140003 RepID=S0P009_9ENTE|nr:glutaredoxin-like protein NrdH [Enterococcus sulfureus]EOT47195.1 glutaredoxin [Enterococcus sulfureus ATCC 49903]EOT83510.1 glutaredoxin [Enterococcus sulfureus ATCC 49903]
MNVKLFSKNNCMQCKMAKRFLTQNNVSFEEINIDTQPEYIDILKEQGFQSVPVVTSDNSSAIIGFRPDQLKQLAS